MFTTPSYVCPEHNDLFHCPSYYSFDPVRASDEPPIYSYPNTSMYASGDSVGSLDQQWQSTQFYRTLTVPAHCDSLSPQTFYHDPAPIYAPAPLPAPVPIMIPALGLQDEATTPDYSAGLCSHSSPTYSYALESVHDHSVVAGSPPQAFASSYEIDISEKCSPMVPTFPTPSELLCDVKSSKGTTSPESDFSERDSSPPTLQPLQSIDLPTGQPSRDGISSHEKKRQLLECLEQYVIYLHEQVTLLGAEPVSLDRVDSYRGLGSRSIRTLLLHMENTNEELNHKVIAEEQRFLKLREAYHNQNVFACPGNPEHSPALAPYV
ncbi:hypothetical protein L218DRAFT_952443 [Marasmius fiardii PR-910]|nr:hypothetical protein L218DRAFT_952443 [Marasmius fiardii PR-910]